jgi:hypothetical protein
VRTIDFLRVLAQQPVILSGAPRHVKICIGPMARSRRTPKILRHSCCIKAFSCGTGAIQSTDSGRELPGTVWSVQHLAVLHSAPLSEVAIKSAWRCVQDDSGINPSKHLVLSSFHTDSFELALSAVEPPAFCNESSREALRRSSTCLHQLSGQK